MVALIPGSRTLPTDSTYGELQRQAGLARPQLMLGLSSLRAAVDYFYNNPDDPVDPAGSRALGRSALVMLQMLSEALRFRPIATRLSVESEQITVDMEDLENSWGDMSAAVLRSDSEYTSSTPLLASEPQRRQWNAWTVSAAIAILAVAVQPSKEGSGLGPGPAKPDPQCGATPLGRMLLEVYFVRINNIDDEDPGDLYGNITVTDALGTETIFREDWLYSISPGQDVPLAGPSRPVSGNGAFSIDLDLWDRDRPPDPSPDDQVARGSIQWNPQEPSNAYDRTHYQLITGEHGSASVQYAVLSEAVTAKVSVILVKGDEDPNDVCGTIKAVTKMDTIVLFDRACQGDTSVPVREGEAIPLRRAMLAVSLEDGLTVEAHLWDWDRLRDDEIANGQGAFAPVKDTKRTINGQYGEIEVNVEWIEL